MNFSKKKTALVVIGFLTLVMGLAFCMVGCNVKGKKELKFGDTLRTNVLYLGSNGLAVAPAKMTVEKSAFIDSATKDAKSKTDTSIFLWVPKDTIKVNGKPIYDTLRKSFAFDSAWFRLSDYQKHNIRIWVLSDSTQLFTTPSLPKLN